MCPAYSGSPLVCVTVSFQATAIAKWFLEQQKEHWTETSVSCQVLALPVSALPPSHLLLDEGSRPASFLTLNSVLGSLPNGCLFHVMCLYQIAEPQEEQ